MRVTHGFVAVGLFLSGCASTSVPSADPPLPGPKASITEIANHAQTRAMLFLETAQGIKQDDTLLDAGLLGAAVGAAASLFYVHPPAQANAVAGIGLGAGGISAWKGRLSTKDAAKAYEEAALQLVCVADVLRPLETVASQKVGSTTSLETSLTKAIASVQSDAAAARPAVSAAISQEIKKQGEELLKSSDSLSLLAVKAVDALSNGGSYAHARIVSIEANLSGKLNGGSINYSALRDSLITSIKSKAETEASLSAASKAPPSSAPTASGMIGAPEEDLAAIEKIRALSISVEQLRQYHSLAQSIHDTKADLNTCEAK